MNKTLLVAAAFMAVASGAMADPAIDLLSPAMGPSGPVDFPGSETTHGFEFSVATAQSIDALGVYDNGMDGLAAGAVIGVWDLSGNLLTSTTIAPGGGVLDGMFRYASITPLLLTAGQHYVVGSYTTDLVTALGNPNFPAVATINPLVTVYRDRYAFNLGFPDAFAFPNESDEMLGGAYLGANFSLAVAPDPGGVPEPETWALMLLGFGALGARLRRRAGGGAAQKIC